MIAAPYSEILAALCDELGWPRNADGTPNLTSEQWHNAKRAIGKAVAEIWPRAFWKDLIQVERRWFAPDWDPGEVVAAQAIRYHRAANRYYLALQDEPATDPATHGPSGWEDVDGGWTRAATEYATEELWDNATAYGVGDRVIHPDTGVHWQCIAAHTAQEPPNALYWGQLVAFRPAVDKFQPGKVPIGQVEGLYQWDPRVYRGAGRLRFVDEESVLTVRFTQPTSVWVRFLPPTPRFSGDTWSASQTYQPAATSTVEVPTPSMHLGYAGRDAVRAITAHRDRQVVYVLWLVTDGDNAGGQFDFRAGSYADDDGVDVLRPTNIAASSPGRYHRSGNVT